MDIASVKMFLRMVLASVLARTTTTDLECFQRSLPTRLQCSGITHAVSESASISCWLHVHWSAELYHFVTRSKHQTHLTTVRKLEKMWISQIRIGSVLARKSEFLHASISICSLRKKGIIGCDLKKSRKREKWRKPIRNRIRNWQQPRNSRARFLRQQKV